MGERTRRRFLRIGGAVGSLWLAGCGGGPGTDGGAGGDAGDSTPGGFSAYEDSWPRGDRDVLRVKHFPPFGEWRAALVYTPADYREAPLLGEALVYAGRTRRRQSI